MLHREDALSIDDLKHFLEIEQGIAEVTRESCVVSTSANLRRSWDKKC